ncbi:Protein F26F4.12 [Aphelenchoides avenae]|nr:Protein F26F4.12 [Aphelenchus avenae]
MASEQSASEPMECDETASQSSRANDLEDALFNNPLTNGDDLDSMDGEVDEEEEQRDEVAGMPSEMWDNIRNEKKAMPSMFVSGWEEDDEGIEPKDLSDPTEQFLTAAEEGHLEALQKLYSQHPELLKATDSDRYTALHRAAYNNRTAVCRWLLSVGADPELRTEDGWTALHCAAQWGNHEVAGILLSHGVNVNATSNGGLTPLHLAINSSGTVEADKQFTTVKYLLEAPGVDLGAVTGAGDNPKALAKRSTAAIHELVEAYLRRL